MRTPVIVWGRSRCQILQLLRNACRIRTIGAVFFHKPDSRYTNVIIVDHDRNRRKALALAGAHEAFPGIEIELGMMLAA